jgi:hypothetical protein
LAGHVHGRAFSYCWIGEKGASSALTRAARFSGPAMPPLLAVESSMMVEARRVRLACSRARLMVLFASGAAPLYATPLNTQPTA